MMRSRVLVLAVLFGALLIGGTVFSLKNERQRQLEVNARVQAAIDVMHHISEANDLRGDKLLDTISLVNLDDVSVETMNRIADMLASDNGRAYAARALELLGSRARNAGQVVPALRRAIAEELAIWKGRRNLIIGAGPTLLDAEFRALANVMGVTVEQLRQHPEQFEKLPPDMQACIETFNAQECEQLMAEWRADPY